MTGSFFSSDRLRIRLKIRCDCAAEPPGELMTRATAFAPGTEKARSSRGATLDMASPERRGITAPMGPDRRTTGTTGWAYVRYLAGRRNCRRAGSMEETDV